MRIPQKKKPRDPVLAADWNMLLDAISARTPMPGAGLELIASSGGFAYSSPGGLLVERQSLPPFAVIGIEKATVGGKPWNVVIKEGWVIERKPRTGTSEPAVKFHMPKVGNDPLNTVPRPLIRMTIGDTLWCKFPTDMQGEISDEPEMIVTDEDQDGTHYQPQDPEESGVAGDYAVKILKLEDDDGSPQVKLYQQSDIEHWAQLWTGENLGGGSRVYKRHADAENKFQFRSLLGVNGIKTEEMGSEIHIGGDGGNLNLEIHSLSYDNDGHIYGSPSLETTLYFRKGIYMGDSDPDDGDPPEGLETYEVHRLVNAA